MQSHDAEAGAEPQRQWAPKPAWARKGCEEKPNRSYVEGGWMDEDGQFFPHHGLQGGVETWIKGSYTCLQIWVEVSKMLVDIV